MERLTLTLTLLCVAVIGCSRQPAAVVSNQTAQDAAPATENLQVVAQEAAAGDWPRWRGPHGDGISRETDWTADWPQSGPEQAWQAEVGIGFSSVAVSAGRLYTMGHSDGRETVYCLNAETGEEVWTHSYQCVLVDNLHEGGPCATPTVEADRVYTLSREGHLFCFDAASGDVVWLKELQDELGVKLPDWGFTCSPLVVGKKLIVEAGRLVAMDKGTGQIVWQTARHRAGYGAPVAFEADQRPMIAALNNDGLLVVAEEDGEELDRWAWKADYETSATTPIVSGSTIFVSTGYNSGCMLLRLVGDELDLVYQNKNMSNQMNNCVLWQDHLYGFDGNSHARRTAKLVCMDYQTGEVKWSERGLGCGSLTLADGKLIVMSDDGSLVIAEATPDRYKEISRAEVQSGKCWTVPVLANGRIYCRNAAGRLVCVSVAVPAAAL